MAVSTSATALTQAEIWTASICSTFDPFNPIIIDDPLLFSQDRFIPDNDGDLDEDWVGSIGVGYAFVNSGFRLEGEIAHRYNDGGGGGCQNLSLITPDFCANVFDFDLFPLARINETKVHDWSFMVNGYYDFNKGGSWEPYVGAGIGAAELLVSNSGQVANVIDTFFDPAEVVSFSNYRISDNNWGFAWQLMAGVAFRATDQLMIDVGYRYHQVDSVDIDGVVFEDPVFDLAQEFFSSSIDYHQSAVLVGLRWQFTAPEPPPPPYTPPPPPPPPPPAACPTQDFVVYFEWDRSNLNQAALDTIDQAVNQRASVQSRRRAGRRPHRHVRLRGLQCGAFGAAGFGGARRARGARRSAGAIRTEARGETDLAKPTPDGVREPLNRRTAVTISFR